MNESTCPSCGAVRTNLYCSQCGEKVSLPQEKTFSHFIGKVFSAITFADNKFLKSLWTIISKPGTLSFDYARGKRNIYTAPVSLFFIGNLLYFLFPVLQTFNTSLDIQVKAMPYSNLTSNVLDTRLATRHITYDEYEKRYNEKSTSHAKLLLVSLVLFMTLGYQVICRTRKYVFGDHLVMSLELNIFNLFITTLFITFLTITMFQLFNLLGADIQPYLNDTTFTIIGVLCMLYFFYFSIRTMYQTKALKALWKSVLLLLWFGLSLYCYRFELFWITFWTT
jgi:hypothetical protein